MDIEFFRDFIAIKTYQSFSEAAEVLCLSQSALSKQIKALESELNVKLFDRSTSKVTLTLDGEKFAFFAEQILSSYNDMLLTMCHPSAKEGVVRLASIQVFEHFGLNKMIRLFQAENPEITVQFQEADAISILQSIEKGSVDLAIMRGFNIPKDRYKIYPLLTDELVFVCPSNHPLAKESSIDLSKAASDKFVFLSVNCGLYNTCLNECIKAGFMPQGLNTTIKVSSIMDFVENQQGVSILMRKVAERYASDKIRIISLKEPVYDPLCIISPGLQSPLSGSCSQFIAFAKNYYKNR